MPSVLESAEGNRDADTPPLWSLVLMMTRLFTRDRALCPCELPFLFFFSLVIHLHNGPFFTFFFKNMVWEGAGEV